MREKKEVRGREREKGSEYEREESCEDVKEIVWVKLEEMRRGESWCGVKSD